ncbi:serine hydrolase domain-containing protein [Longispora albida]|uniref:serine hydrolase domain-containing protein n=1 Tax=Longispora albida TaxID=203523 RepID=UPI000376F7BA|nr:serine hydrolase domain-containing protein [Longispora albida]
MSTKKLLRPLLRAGVTALAAALLAGVAAAPGAASAHDGTAARKRPELQKAMQDIAASGFTGVQLRVRDQRGEWAGSAGVRELGGTARPSVNGRFRVGSVTKTFTATVVLQLVAEGRIGLDTPVAGLLPEFALDRRITVRMLLQHTSGIFNFTGEYLPDGTVVPGIVSAGKEWVSTRFRTYTDEELVRFALSHQPRFEPGASWSYSNTNYVLAKLLIERVSGRSYATETHRRIIQPLGLRGTFVPGTSTEIPGQHAHAYYSYEENGEQKTVDVSSQNPSWISAAGDMISTTEDLGTFVSALMRGRLLPLSLVAEMRTPDPVAGYGYGLFVLDGVTPSPFPQPSCKVTLVTHNGGVQGYGTLMYSTPDGRRTLTASLTYVDNASGSMQGPGRSAMQRLVNEVFCDGRA